MRRVFENRAQRRIFEHEKEEVRRRFRKPLKRGAS
jgi:hypothetical protein